MRRWRPDRSLRRSIAGRLPSGPEVQGDGHRQSCIVIYAIEMSLGYDIYADIGLLYIRGQGVITQRQRMSAMLAWLREPQYECCRDALIDFTDVTTTPKVAELRELIAMLKQEMPPRGPRRLAMVTSKPITFAVARTFGHLVRSQNLPFEVKVFMNLGRAWTWLRPDEPPFQLR
jgi:hypothetical protein